MSTLADRLVATMRVPPTLPQGEQGLWRIRRYGFEDSPFLLAAFQEAGLAPYHTMTALQRLADRTLAAFQRDERPSPWETVMEDSPVELRRHLPAVLAARGRVLVTGLGLGCVLRGILARPAVHLVDVVERDPAILELVGAAFRADPRVRLHLADAETWPLEGRSWDVAWHDLWTEAEALAVLHARVLARYAPHVRWQGVWGLERWVRSIWPVRLIGASRRRHRPTRWAARARPAAAPARSGDRPLSCRTSAAIGGPGAS